MDSKQVRKKFISFFEERGHLKIPSVKLLSDDPALLFISAGMIPLEPYLLEEIEPSKNRQRDGFLVE